MVFHSKHLPHIHHKAYLYAIDILLDLHLNFILWIEFDVFDDGYKSKVNELKKEWYYQSVIYNIPSNSLNEYFPDKIKSSKAKGFGKMMDYINETLINDHTRSIHEKSTPTEFIDVLHKKNTRYK